MTAAAIINALAERTGRPIDLIDLKTVGLPLLGQIVHHGHRLLGSDAADFMPLHNRILAERRTTWLQQSIATNHPPARVK